MSTWQETSWVSGLPGQGLGCCFVENCPLSSKDQLVSCHLQETFPKDQRPGSFPSLAFYGVSKGGHLINASVCPALCWWHPWAIDFYNNPWRQAVLLLPFSRWGHWGSVRLSQWLRVRWLETPCTCFLAACCLSVPGVPCWLYLLFIQSCIFLISGLKIRFHFISTILHSLSLPPPSMPGTQSMDQSALGKWMMPRPRWVWLDCVLLYIGSLAAFYVECEPLPYLSVVQRLSVRPAFMCWDPVGTWSAAPGEWLLSSWACPTEPVRWGTRGKASILSGQDNGRGRRSTVGPLGSPFLSWTSIYTSANWS